MNYNTSIPLNFPNNKLWRLIATQVKTGACTLVLIQRLIVRILLVLATPLFKYAGQPQQHLEGHLHQFKVIQNYLTLHHNLQQLTLMLQFRE